MFCPECGAQCADNIKFCPKCGTQLTNVQQTPKFNEMLPIPNNYLVFAILSTIFCCWPLGIISIIKSVQVDRKLHIGAYNEAVKASRSAKNWAIASAVSALVIFFIYIIFLLICIAAGIEL